MNLNEELCICFHVPAHKVAKYIRLNDPPVASFCSDCYGAGTGCGWCIPFIEKMFEQIKAGETEPDLKLSGREYRERRKEYLKKVKMDRMKPEEPEGGGTGRGEKPLVDAIDEDVDLE